MLDGFEGKIEVEGVKYNSYMSSFSYLSDKEVSAVLTYVRNSFGNDTTDVSVAEVAKVRAALGK